MRDMDELRPLTAGRLLELWRGCGEIGDPLERVLICNGRIIAQCCFFQGRRVYENELETLEELTPRQLEHLLLRLAEGGGPSDRRPGESRANPAFDAARFEALRGSEQA